MPVELSAEASDPTRAAVHRHATKEFFIAVLKVLTRQAQNKFNTLTPMVIEFKLQSGRRYYTGADLLTISWTLNNVFVKLRR